MDSIFRLLVIPLMAVTTNGDTTNGCNSTGNRCFVFAVEEEVGRTAGRIREGTVVVGSLTVLLWDKLEGILGLSDIDNIDSQSMYKEIGDGVKLWKKADVMISPYHQDRAASHTASGEIMATHAEI
ncbi:hypothetical protein L2E82_03565 [Cichorium intybus]|uniref:Uncharacterized protein n=1 Tax=Cichorium intybus TaxID=13427 RepID=A0ACB9H467_CICIN|nr:hypothetical protein L2E82_03565 [Cichorium intybus]